MSRFVVDADVALSDFGNTVLVIHHNKDVYLGDAFKDVKVGTVREIPAHGRLIEAHLDYAEFKKRYRDAFGDNPDLIMLFLFLIA